MKNGLSKHFWPLRRLLIPESVTPAAFVSGSAGAGLPLCRNKSFPSSAPRLIAANSSNAKAEAFRTGEDMEASRIQVIFMFPLPDATSRYMVLNW
jgi:hypothetical protein